MRDTDMEWYDSTAKAPFCSYQTEQRKKNLSLATFVIDFKRNFWICKPNKTAFLVLYHLKRHTEKVHQKLPAAICLLMLWLIAFSTEAVISAQGVHTHKNLQRVNGEQTKQTPDNNWLLSINPPKKCERMTELGKNKKKVFFASYL